MYLGSTELVDEVHICGKDREELSVSLGMWIFAAGLGWFSSMGK